MGRGDAAIAAIGRDARRELSKVIVDTMTLAVRNLSNSTPVDTEHAASNWIVTFGSPFKGVAGSRVNVSWSEFYNGLAKLKRYDVGRDGRVYIRNNVLYLQYLDRGWSQQAPPGFVAMAMTAAAQRAPFGRKMAARKMLRAMARQAYRRGT